MVLTVNGGMSWKSGLSGRDCDPRHVAVLQLGQRKDIPHPYFRFNPRYSLEQVLTCLDTHRDTGRVCIKIRRHNCRRSDPLWVRWRDIDPKSPFGGEKECLLSARVQSFGTGLYRETELGRMFFVDMFSVGMVMASWNWWNKCSFAPGAVWEHCTEVIGMGLSNFFGN